jgi:hypothetical protein
VAEPDRALDRLAQTARERIGADPMQGGALFVFANTTAQLREIDGSAKRRKNR